MKALNREKLMPLSAVPVGSKVRVNSLLCKGLMRRRMMDLGLIPNVVIYVIRKSPLGDPTAYEIKGAQIALREEEAKQIMVEVEV